MLVTFVLLMVISAFIFGWVLHGKKNDIFAGVFALTTVTLQLSVLALLTIKYHHDVFNGDIWIIFVVIATIASAVILGYFSHYITSGFHGKSGRIIGIGLFLLGCAIVFVGLTLVGWGVVNEDLRQLFTGMVAGSSGVIFSTGGVRNLEK